MVPRLSGGRLGLRAGIVHWHGAMAVHAVLLHGYSVQVTLVPEARAARLSELLASVVHGLVHSG